MHYMELGGAERALLGLLDALDPARVQVDLFLNQHTGDFLPLVPGWVRLLPERRGYNAIERPMRTVVREGQWRVALARLRARCRHAAYVLALTPGEREIDASVFQYVMSEVEPLLPSVGPCEGEESYDLAISFLQPHNFVLSKVRARKKICWIHTDYSTVHVNVAQELPLWGAYDHIVSISPDCTRAFLKTFPSLKPKIIEIENILSPAFVRLQAALGDAPELQAARGEDVNRGGGRLLTIVTVGRLCHQKNVDNIAAIMKQLIEILSVGRISHAKNYDNVPDVCRRLVDQCPADVQVRWFILGPGDDSLVRRRIAEAGMQEHVVLLGARSNPYPYIAACDIYCQPSRYEGKSVTVREAQMLCRPVLITAYPTAHSQVSDGQDGIIAPMDNAGCAAALARLVMDAQLRQRLSDYCAAHDFGNEAEVQKIYSLLDE